jgi:hypothetical protein
MVTGFRGVERQLDRTSGRQLEGTSWSRFLGLQIREGMSQFQGVN